MEGSPWKVLLAAIAFIQLIHAEVTLELPEPGKRLQFFGGTYGVYKADFPLLDNETEVVYARNVGPGNVFAYATRDPSKKTAVLKIVPIKGNTEFGRDQRCEFDFDVPDNSTVVLDRVRIASAHRAFGVSFAWHIKGNEKDVHVDNVNSITCHHAEMLRDKKNFTFRAEETATLAAELAKLEIPEGYHLADKANAASSTVRINYVNETSGVVSLTGTIDNLPRVDGLWVESVDMDRYGVCYEADMNLTCAQGPLRAKVEPGKLEKWASLPLPRYHAWYGVVNYAEGRILLILGDSRGSCNATTNCDHFLLYEMRPGGKIYWHASMTEILLGGCSNPAELTVDAYHHVNGTCFSMACIGLADSKRTLKYRQTCATLV